MQKIIFLFVISLSLFSCDSENKKQATVSTKLSPPKNVTITKKNHTEGEILVVIDTAYWNASIGDSVRKIFGRAVYGLPQGDPFFKVRRVDPHLFKGALKKFNNIIVVANVNSTSISSRYMNALLGEKNIHKAKSKEANKPPFYVNSDLYAKGQNVVYLLAESDKELKEKLSESREGILYYFDKKVALQFKNRYYYGHYNENLTKTVNRKFEVDFHIPRGYQFAKEEEGFLWLRFPEAGIDKNIVISELDYTSEIQFSDEFIAQWRDSLGLHLIKEKEDTSFYMMTQSYMPLQGEVLIGGKTYSKLCRGLWKLKDNSLGGPFVSFVTLNKAQTKIYYIEGFVAAPGISKRKLVRELRAVVTSFRG